MNTTKSTFIFRKSKNQAQKVDFKPFVREPTPEKYRGNKEKESQHRANQRSKETRHRMTNDPNIGPL